jgi:hypothetical protein
MDDQDFILARELDHPLHEGKIDGRGRRVVREIHHQQLGPRPASVDRHHQRIEKILAAADRHALHLRTRDDASVLMNRVRRSRREHHVALVENRECEMRYPLLGADRDDRFRVGIKLDSVAAAVPIRNRHSQLVHSARDRVAMVRRLGRGLDQLGHNMRGRGGVGIPHAEVDDVLALAPGLQTEFANRVEDVRWQPLYSGKIHDAPCKLADAACPHPDLFCNRRRAPPLVGLRLPSARHPERVSESRAPRRTKIHRFGVILR